MKLEEIKTAVRNGQTVFWKSHHYPVSMTQLKNGEEQWLVCCTDNNHCIGLTWQDGVTMNGEEKDFHTAPYPTAL
jgi:hypothetical protein